MVTKGINCLLGITGFIVDLFLNFMSERFKGCKKVNLSKSNGLPHCFYSDIF